MPSFKNTASIFPEISFIQYFPHFSCKQWCHHWSNLHNRKTSISLKRKKIFQKEKHQFSVFWKGFTNYVHAKDKWKRAINTRGNLVFTWRNYHPKQFLTFLSRFPFGCSSTLYLAFHCLYTISSSARKSSPSLLKILQIALKALSSEFTAVVEYARCRTSAVETWLWLQ